jgi:glutathione S-transferase
MLLIGMFDSPFVRRVAVSMKLSGIPFEHANWSVGKDFERIREFNPLARVPALVIGSKETLVESGAILDYIDELAGSERRLLPAAGPERRQALKLMAIATGAAEKGVAQVYERVFRPEEKRHAPWVDRCHRQMNSALAALDAEVADRGASQWLVGKRMTQADITVACAFTFLNDALRVAQDRVLFSSLATLAQRCESLPEFQETRTAFFTPSN